MDVAIFEPLPVAFILSPHYILLPMSVGLGLILMCRERTFLKKANFTCRLFRYVFPKRLYATYGVHKGIPINVPGPQQMMKTLLNIAAAGTPWAALYSAFVC